MKIVDLSECSDDVILYINKITNILSNEIYIKKKAIKYIKEHCIDDEFYNNLTNKEKNIFDVLNILERGDL